MNIHHAKVYSYYEIVTIVFYWTMIVFLPVLMVFSYILDLQNRFEVFEIINVALIIVGVVTLVGTVVLLVKKNKLKRIVKTHYRSEFIFLVFINAFSILGFVVLYDYLKGNRNYIANILVVLVALIFAISVYFGKKYFKLDYISRR